MDDTDSNGIDVMSQIPANTIRRFGAPLIAAALLLLPALAAAQNSTLNALNDRMSRLERQLSELERWAASDGKAPPPGQSGGSAGIQSATNPAQLADAEVRLSRLESQIREMNGQIERIAHEVRSASQRMDKLVGDVDFRLTEIERQLSAIGQPAANAATPGAAQPDAAATQSVPAATAPAAAAAVAPSQTAGLPDGTPMERYDYAYSLLRKLKLAEAEAAFKEFLSLHGDDKLAGNAQYWLGETYYTRGDMQQAARTFLEGVQRYPESNKTPDSMLKLAISLRRLNQTQDACATLSELASRFPNMEAPIRRKMDQEREAANCP